MSSLGAIVDIISCRPGGIDLTGCIRRVSVSLLSAQCRSAVCTSHRVGVPLMLLMDMLFSACAFNS